ncbi:hypothetical protein EON68_02095 [archaeon]|nr:MAG: hypothetical protein EON68_02095 [archaeon]
MQVFLIDPAGSALLSYVKTGEFVATPGKTVSEGIGQSRLTRNIAHAQVDDAMFGSDEELVAMAYYLLRYVTRAPCHAPARRRLCKEVHEVGAHARTCTRAHARA